MDSNFVKTTTLVGVFTSITAGVMLWIVEFVSDSIWWFTNVPLWIAFVFSLIYFLVMIIVSRMFWNKPKKVFLIISTFGRAEFFAALIEKVVHELGEHGIDTVIKLRTQGARGLEQDRHFREILSERNNYLGGIVVPAESMSRKKQIMKFVETLKKPVVFLDEDPFYNDGSYPPNSCFVGVDNKAGGRFAAEELALRLRHSDAEGVNCRVVVVSGDKDSVRQNSFEQRLSELMPASTLVRRSAAGFSKEEARRVGELELQDAKFNDGTNNAFFCLTDQLALGVADAIKKSYAGGDPKPPIVGFDGVQQAVAEVQSADSPIVATVIQDVDAIAQQAVDSLMKLNSGDYPNESRSFVKPQIYRQSF